jgi:hypothetical protein
MPPVKYAIAIKSCHKYAERQQAQRDTWIADLDVDYFHVIGICPPGTRPAPSDSHLLACDISDAFTDIAPKVWCACRYALEASLTNLFVCDDDTYVVPERLARAATRRDYVGWVRPGPGWDVPYMQGSAYLLGERALEYIVRAVEIMQPGVIDDGAVGRVLVDKVAYTHDRRFYPGPQPEWITSTNNLISTHKCLPAQMRAIHEQWKKTQR